MEGSDVVRKKNFNRQKPRAETQKIIVVFFGVCTGVVMWLALDFRDESILVHTKSSSNDESTVINLIHNSALSLKQKLNYIGSTSRVQDLWKFELDTYEREIEEIGK